VTPEQLNAWIVLVGVLMATAAKTVAQIKTIFSAAELTEDEQNAILHALMDENRRRRAISAAIAGLSVEPAPVPVPPVAAPQADGDPGLTD
jgi:hypothetical protein